MGEPHTTSTSPCYLAVADHDPTSNAACAVQC